MTDETTADMPNDSSVEAPVEPKAEDVAEIGNILEFAPKEVESDHYEVMILQTAAETEEAAQKVHDTLGKEVEGVGGSITTNEFVGQQALAYTVNNVKTGYYSVIEFDMEKPRVSELNEKLRIRKDVARFMIVKKHIPSEEEVAENTRIQGIIENRKKQKMIKGLAPKESAVAEGKKAAKKERKTREQQKPQSLEKQLEKLLSDDIDV